MRESAVAIIPARYNSTRLPGKALASIGGRPMVCHVAERTRRARGLERVIVATDDMRIADAVRAAGGEVALTRSDHPSGTDRLAEVARELDAAIVVNVQGDLPLLDPAMVERLVACLRADPSLPMATLAAPLAEDAEWRSPHVVKVVFGGDGRALYFSRSPIPYYSPFASCFTLPTLPRTDALTLPTLRLPPRFGPQQINHLLVSSLREHFIIAADRIKLRIRPHDTDLIGNFFQAFDRTGRADWCGHNDFGSLLFLC